MYPATKVDVDGSIPFKKAVNYIFLKPTRRLVLVLMACEPLGTHTETKCSVRRAGAPSFISRKLGFQFSLLYQRSSDIKSSP